MQYMIRAIVCLCCVWGMLQAGEVIAAPYTVYGIAVQADGANGTEAREKAQKQAERKAFDELAVQAGRTPETLAHVTPEMLSLMVTGYEVEEEKIAPGSYQAVLNVSFDEYKLRQVFQELPTQAAAPSKKNGKTLIIPVLTHKGQDFIWEEPNPWKDAWEHYVKQADNEMVIPLGDLEDIAALNPQMVRQRNWTGMGKLARRYEADTIVLAEAALRDDGEGIILEGELESGNGYGSQGDGQIFRVEGQSLDTGLFNTAVQQSLALLDDSVQVAASPTHTASTLPPQHLKTLIQLQNTRDWVGIRRMLGQLPMVQQVEVIAITPGQVDVTIHYRGEASQLAQSVQPMGFQLTPYSGYWVLARSGVRG